jgi:hypothetical protein
MWGNHTQKSSNIHAIAQVRLCQIGPAKIGVDEASSSQIRSIELGVGKIDSMQAGGGVMRSGDQSSS